MGFEIVYWHWLVLGMVLMMFEIVLPCFIALWFGARALLISHIVRGKRLQILNGRRFEAAVKQPVR